MNMTAVKFVGLVMFAYLPFLNCYAKEGDSRAAEYGPELNTS